MLDKLTSELQSELDNNTINHRITLVSKSQSAIKVEELADEVIECLLQDGEFRKQGDRIFYREFATTRLIEIRQRPEDTEFGHYLNYNYGLSQGAAGFVKVYNDIKTYAFTNGSPITVKTTIHYDKEQNTIYISNNHPVPSVYKITTDHITLEQNGVDDLHFIHNPKHSAFDIRLDQIEPTGKFNKLFLDEIWFEDNPTQLLTVQDQRHLLRTFFYGIFFRSVIVECPILVIIGNKGSGKTTTARMIGSILYGENFKESILRGEERDFFSALIHTNYLVIDNFDNEPYKTFMDQLAALSTGASIKNRRLYTDITDPGIDVAPNAVIAITTRSPRFNREDVMSRCILITLGKQSILYGTEFQSKIFAARQEVLEDVVANLQIILSKLAATQDRSYSHNFRMTDFANFALRISDDPKMMSDIFARLASEQSKLSIDFLPWLREFITFIEEDESLWGKRFTATEIVNLVKSRFDENNLFRNLTARSVGKQLHQTQEDIQRLIPFIIEPSGNNTFYVFGSAAANTTETNIELVQQALLGISGVSGDI